MGTVTHVGVERVIQGRFDASTDPAEQSHHLEGAALARRTLAA
jgi:hypothetical protein